jgi:hypothetical protein
LSVVFDPEIRKLRRQTQPARIISNEERLAYVLPRKKESHETQRGDLLCSSLLGSTLTFAQGLGSIVGTVTDKSGAAVTAAKITVVESGTGATRDAEPDTQGYY